MIEAAEDVTIPSFKKGMAPRLVKTGIKAYMQDDEFLALYNRSSNPKKKGLILANSVGIIDKDYYGNPDNDGHIMFAFYNIKEEDVVIKKGEAIGQGIFQKFFAIDNDSDNLKVRSLLPSDKKNLNLRSFFIRHHGRK